MVPKNKEVLSRAIAASNDINIFSSTIYWLLNSILLWNSREIATCRRADKRFFRLKNNQVFTITKFTVACDCNDDTFFAVQFKNLINMKKIVFVFAFILGAGAVAQAQYRPEGGEKNIEVNFAPLGGSPVSITGIKLRSFSSQTSALRLGVFVGWSNSNEVTQEEEEVVVGENDQGELLDIELRDRVSTMSIALQPGIEKHFAGTERLSPYVGAFVNIGYSSKKETWEKQYAPVGNVADLPAGDESSIPFVMGQDITRTGTLNLGLNGVAGFDYYVAKHLYLGAEVGFGFAMNKDLKSKTENTANVLNDDQAFIEEVTEGESILNNKSSMQIGPNVIGQLRMGWLF